MVCSWNYRVTSIDLGKENLYLNFDLNPNLWHIELHLNHFTKHHYIYMILKCIKNLKNYQVQCCTCMECGTSSSICVYIYVWSDKVVCTRHIRMTYNIDESRRWGLLICSKWLTFSLLRSENHTKALTWT